MRLVAGNVRGENAEVPIANIKHERAGTADGPGHNTQHQPLTVTDAALQTTTFTYTPTGDLTTVVTPARGSLTQAQRTTTYQYYSDTATFGPGRQQQITGPLSGATTNFSYDGYGRVRTVTESDGYAVTTDYDAFDRPRMV